jgi:hypothetical protein
LRRLLLYTLRSKTSAEDGLAALAFTQNSKLRIQNYLPTSLYTCIIISSIITLYVKKSVHSGKKSKKKFENFLRDGSICIHKYTDKDPFCPIKAPVLMLAAAFYRSAKNPSRGRFFV